jgi:hypothetical protein
MILGRVPSSGLKGRTSQPRKPQTRPSLTGPFPRPTMRYGHCSADTCGDKVIGDQVLRRRHDDECQGVCTRYWRRPWRRHVDCDEYRTRQPYGPQDIRQRVGPHATSRGQSSKRPGCLAKDLAEFGLSSKKDGRKAIAVSADPPMYGAASPHGWSATVQSRWTQQWLPLPPRRHRRTSRP